MYVHHHGGTCRSNPLISKMAGCRLHRRGRRTRTLHKRIDLPPWNSCFASRKHPESEQASKTQMENTTMSFSLVGAHGVGVQRPAVVSHRVRDSRVWLILAPLRTNDREREACSTPPFPTRVEHPRVVLKIIQEPARGTFPRSGIN